MGKLIAVLRALDAVLPEPAARSLSKPASRAAVEALRRGVFGAKLPSELAEWFGWHDGQRHALPLDPKNNFTAMPAKRVQSTWKMLNGPKNEGIRPPPSWLPLFENGGGDHLMYETAGSNRGGLFAYWHDDERRSRKPEYVSLADWAARVSKAQAREAKKLAKGGAAPKLSLDALKFEKLARAPTRAALEKAPIGTLIRCQHRENWFSAWMKVSDDAWVWNAERTLPATLKGLAVELGRWKRSELRCDAGDVNDALRGLKPEQRKTLAIAKASG